MDTSKYAELFLTESRDNLVATNEALLRLERDPQDGEAIDAAFRAVHTIKGMAGVMGYTCRGRPRARHGDVARLRA